MDGKNCYSDEHYLPTFFNVRIMIFGDLHYLLNCCSSLLNLSLTISRVKSSYFPFPWKPDAWSSRHFELVCDTCWLVWREVASKIVQGSRCYLWAYEKYNSKGQLFPLTVETLKIASLLCPFASLWHMFRISLQSISESVHVTSDERVKILLNKPVLDSIWIESWKLN